MAVELTWVIGIAVTIFLAIGAGGWKYLDKQFDRLHERVTEVESIAEQERASVKNELIAIQRELYRDFVRRDDHDALAKSLREDFSTVFRRLDEMNGLLSRSLGQQDILHGARGPAGQAEG